MIYCYNPMLFASALCTSVPQLWEVELADTVGN